MTSSIKEFAHLQISLEDVLKATNNFADKNIIGEGDFGRVYKGQLLQSGKLVKIAARRLDRKHQRGVIEFWTEISELSILSHENLVTVIGFCDKKDEKIIINSYNAKGSLSMHLRNPTLTWIQRLNICIGIARALSYIHNLDGRSYSVLHRNINSSTILLDDKFEAKLSGFEYSIKYSVYRMNQVLLSEAIGTKGYMDPAIEKTGGVTEKSDIYSFGVVLWEVLCGRKAFIPNEDEDNRFLASLAKFHYENDTLNDIIHPDLREQIDPLTLTTFSKVAYSCIRDERVQRPDMTYIVHQLERALGFQPKSPKQGSKEESEEESEEEQRFEGLKLKELAKFPAQEKEDLKLMHEKLMHEKLENKLEHLKIPLSEIMLATDNFNSSKKVGISAIVLHYETYEAELDHYDKFDQSSVERKNNGELPKRRKTVFIRRLIRRKDNRAEEVFFTEIEMYSKCNHHNISTLLGFCNEGSEMIIVTGHASNGHLYNYLKNVKDKPILSWTNRLKICLGVAHGLKYLHYEMEDQKMIINGAINSMNIGLDKNWVATICFLGFSEFLPLNEDVPYFGVIKETELGLYIDPIYKKTRKVKRESDVYCFGVLLFEILFGTVAYNPIYHREGLASVARRGFHEGTLMEMIDPVIKDRSGDYSFTLNRGLDKNSLKKFIKIAYECLNLTQNQRPTMKVVVKELQKALFFHENNKDEDLRISLEQITMATQNFHDDNCIGRGGFGKVYRGKVPQDDGFNTIVAKRLDTRRGQGEQQFRNELQILFEYKHENIIRLIGYCNEKDAKVVVTEYASRGSLDRHLNKAHLTWMKRLNICIDVATALEFLHGGVATQATLIHRDIKAANILLNDEWKAKLADFGLSLICAINQETNYVIDHACGTESYVDPLYQKSGFLTMESDIYSFGVVLFEILCGRSTFTIHKHEGQFLPSFIKQRFEEGKQDEVVFEAMKTQILPKALSAFQSIAYRCLHDDREQRPTAKQVLEQLKKALEFHADIEIWEPKLPRDYKEIFQMSKTPEIHSTEKKKDLYEMLSKGILLEKGKVWVSLSNDGEKNEMISAEKFSFINPRSHKWRSFPISRFHKVAKMLDISSLNIQIKLRTQFLSPGVTYGVHLVFKFEDLRKRINKPMYVNLRYKMGSETLESYFATWRDDGWMMIELDRFFNQKGNIDFQVLLESFSRCYCESDAIYVEGVEFRAIDSVKHGEIEKLKEDERVLNTNSNMDHMQQLPTKNEEVFERSETDVEGEKSLSETEVSRNICHMLPSREILYDPSNVKLFNSKPSDQSRFREVIELLPKQVFRIKCKIEIQTLSSDTDYMCYLVFKLSEKCRGLHCPVKVQGIHKKTIEAAILYFRSPDPWNLLDNNRVPKQREDGWMEVIMWKFNSNHDLKKGCISLNLKLVNYQGTMSGLIVEGLEFRPM